MSRPVSRLTVPPPTRPPAPADLRVHTVPCEGGEIAIFEFAHSELSILTPTERAVAYLVIGGRSNQQIADERGTSANTVAKQVASVFKKLGVRSRADLVSKTLLLARA